MIRRILSILLVCGVGASCGANDTAQPEDLVVRIGFGIGPSARASGVNVLAQLLYAEPLVVHDWSGRPLPRLLSSWNRSPNGRRWTLRLKEGVQFHNGTTVSADTVVRVLQNQKKEGRFGLDYVTNITPEDGRTVVVDVSQPDMFLMAALNEVPVTHPENNAIATGPFRLIRREPIVEVQRFGGYHEGQPEIAGVQIRTFDTQRSAWAALMRGEVDVVQEVSRESVEFMEGSSDVTTYPSVQAFNLALVFNHRNSVLSKAEVRRAIAESIDRTAIIDRVMRGKGRLAEDPIWPFHWAYPTQSPRHEYNPDRAAGRLDKAGYRLPETSRQGEQRKRLSFKCMVYSEDPQFERIALLVQRQLFDVGIVMDIELLNLETLVKRASSGDYDALLIPVYSGRAIDYTYRFWRSGGAESQMLNSGYTGADRLFDELRSSLSDEETARVVERLAAKFHEDVPAVFLAWTEVTRAVSNRLDVGSSGSQDPFFNIWQWRPREVPQR